jgi:hypothetical protein
VLVSRPAQQSQLLQPAADRRAFNTIRIRQAVPQRAIGIAELEVLDRLW